MTLFNLYMFNNDYILTKLNNSKFRASFHLKKKDFEYIEKVGIEKIKSHAYDFINTRLKPYPTLNDGKQTPYKGHPIFIAQHHCACCCRGCLNKWYQIDKNRELTPKEVDDIVNLLMDFIEKEVNLYGQNRENNK